jgi:autotransporter-associated beta strand protein
MRLRRSFLILAAGLSASVPVTRAADVAVNTDLTINSLATMTNNNYIIGDATLTIDLRNSSNSPVDGTYIGRFKDDSTGTGTLFKTGGGTLQYNGFDNIDYFGNRSFQSGPLTAPSDLRPLANNPNALGSAGAGAGFAGSIIVHEGTLQVEGFINQWADYGAFNNRFNLAAGQMFGASSVTVEAGAKLTFQNTLSNLVNANADLAGATPNIPATPLVARLNFVNNLQAATTSVVEVGKSSDYILVAHADFATAGLVPGGTTSLGVLSGQGRFYKTGADAMIIRGNSTFTGETVLAGGDTTLASVNGDTLWSANSVNLASSGAGQGSNTPALADTGAALRWKPGYAPGAGSNTLIVSGDQRIRNFQSLFGEGGVYQPILPGTGAGSIVEISASTDVLRITQAVNFDGFYTGAFTGSGTLQKNGAGTLALICIANSIATIDVNEGKLISNVQSLGTGVVNIGAAGSLSIVQNDSGALRSLITSSSALSELRFKPTDGVYYRGSSTLTQVGNNDVGVADITRAQVNFFGKVIVEDGNAIVFSPEAIDAFANASAIQLLSGPSGRESSIRFNDTNQIANNLSGDANTRIFLGRGNITLGMTVASTYAGGIEGVGNLVKTGAATFTLSGSTTYFGATVVKAGSLAVTSTSGILNTSGLVLKSTTSFSGTGAQSVGALFGQAGTTVTVGGNLTVGISEDLRGRLSAELLSRPITVPAVSPAYYLATDTTNLVSGFTPATTLTFLVQQYGLGDTTGDGTVSAAEALTYLDTNASGVIDQAEIDARRDLLAYAGNITLTGTNRSLIKVGTESLVLTGTATYSGLTDVQGGRLQVGVATLVGTSGINIGADGVFTLDVGSTNQVYTKAISGTGVFQKIGTGRLDLDSTSTNFSGTYDVAAGILAVTFAQGSTAGITNQGDASMALGATFIAKVATNLSWAGTTLGQGSFIKTGAGTLTMTTGSLLHTGLTDVQQGGLRVSTAPVGDLNIATGATFTADIAAATTFSGLLTGGGNFVKLGVADMQLLSANPGFTGNIQINAGSLTISQTNALSSAQLVSISDGATLFIAAGASQTLANIVGTSGATINALVPATQLSLGASAGVTNNFAAQIVGNPVITKIGTGKLTFLRPAATPNEISTIIVQAGELEASKAGLGSANIEVQTGATLRFFADTGVVDSYIGVAITGAGFIAKSGTGTVDLSGSNLTSVDTLINVGAGTLIVSETALGNGRAPLVLLSSNAVFEYRATNSATFGVGNFAGSGSVIFNRTSTNTPTITLNPNGSGTTGYNGLTTVRAGVTLKLNTGFTSITGIATDAGSTLDLSSLSSLDIFQDTDTAFAGSLVGSANLTIFGAGLLDYTANGGNLSGYTGTVAVDDGRLGVSANNTKAVALSNGATLVITGGGNNYTGQITGSGDVYLGNGTDINLTAGSNAATTTLSSAAVDTLILGSGSRLTVNLTSVSVLANTPIRLDGGLLDVVATGSVTLNLANINTTPGAFGGIGGLQLSATGGSASYALSGYVVGNLVVGSNVTAQLSRTIDPTTGFVGQQITGNLTVNGVLTLGTTHATTWDGGIFVAGDGLVGANGILRGDANFTGTLTNNGRLETGYSPGTIYATNFVNTGTIDAELSSNDEDTVLFSGSATLNSGGASRLELSRYGPGIYFGRRHVLFMDTVSAGSASYGTSGAVGEDPRFAAVVSTDAVPLRTLLVYPTQLQGGLDGILGNADDTQDTLYSLAVAGEVAVYVVRARADYEFSTVNSQVVDWAKDITQVDLVDLGGGDWRSDRASSFTALGARFATLDDANLRAALENLTPRGQAAFATGIIASQRAEQNLIARRLETSRFDMAGSSVKTSQWFFDVTSGKTEVDNGPSASITGATAGFIRDIGFDGYAGFSFSIDKSDGNNASTTANSNGYRIGAFGGTMTDKRTLAIDVGASLASVSGDVTRNSVFGGNNAASPSATSLSGWVRASTASAIDESLSITPYAQIQVSSTKLSSLSESGNSDALSVDDATVNEATATLGAGLQNSWVSSSGGWRYRLALDVSYVAQLSGDTTTFDSGIPDEGLAKFSNEQRILPGSGFSVAPTFTFGPSPEDTYTVSVRFDQASEGNATAFQFGYRKRF